jgi:hypothetical protein
MRVFLLLCFCLYGSLLFCQSLLSGTVVEAANQEPIPFATVYFDGTTIGQTTDEHGTFQLSAEQIELPALLVVSHVGYQTLSLSVDSVQQELKLALRIQEQMISTVVVQDRDRRQKNLEEFRQVFLGSDAWGAKGEYTKRGSTAVLQGLCDRKIRDPQPVYEKPGDGGRSAEFAVGP